MKSEIKKADQYVVMDRVLHAVFFISIIYKQHFFQLVKFPKKISNKLVFWPEKKQHLHQALSNNRLVTFMVFISNQFYLASLLNYLNFPTLCDQPTQQQQQQLSTLLKNFIFRRSSLLLLYFQFSTLILCVFSISNRTSQNFQG